MFKYIVDKIEAKVAIKKAKELKQRFKEEAEKNPYEDLRIDMGDIKTRHLYRLLVGLQPVDPTYLVCKDLEERDLMIKKGVKAEYIITLKQYKELTNNSFQKISRDEYTLFQIMPSLFWNVEARSAYASRPKNHRHWWWIRYNE